MGFKALDVAVSLVHTPCAVLAALTALTSSPCSRWRSAPWIDGDGGLWRVPLNLRSASGGFLSLWWIYLAVRENHCPLLHQQMGWNLPFSMLLYTKWWSPHVIFIWKARTRLAARYSRNVSILYRRVICRCVQEFALARAALSSGTAPKEVWQYLLK